MTVTDDATIVTHFRPFLPPRLLSVSAQGDAILVPLVHGDTSGWQKHFVDLVPTLLAAGGDDGTSKIMGGFIFLMCHPVLSSLACFWAPAGIGINSWLLEKEPC